MKKSLFYCSLILLVTACNKKMSPTDSNIISKDLVVVWEKELIDTNQLISSMHPLIHGNTLLTSYQLIDSVFNEVIIAINKSNGTQLWSWNEYIRPAPQRVRGSERMHIKDNILLACSSQDNYAIDIASGNTIWATNIEEGGSRTSVFGNYLFSTSTFGNAPYGDSSQIIDCNINTGIWNSIYKVSKLDEFEVRLGTPAFYINSLNDTLLIFQNRQINLSDNIEKADLYCYNMTRDSICWFMSNISSSGSSNARVPIVDDDRLYFAGKWDLLCIDIESGVIIWNHNLYWDYQGSNYLINDDLIITNLDNGDLIALDKYNGNQVWVNEGLSGCCVELRIYNSRIYFGNLNLYIVDAKTGSLLHKFKSPHYLNGGEFRNAIEVDLITNRMYTTDGKYILCMELPE